MRILAIETSCDDTGLALVNINLRSCDDLRLDISVSVEQNLVSSQTEIHRHWGGVVPNLAKREHIKNLPTLYDALVASGQWLIPDYIAVTVGPGLEPALWAGIEFAKKLGKELHIPIVGANHLEGHLYSFLLQEKTVQLPEFPAVMLLVSGGHTTLVMMHNLWHWKKLGETQDDAVGEAFDKVARMLHLPYPGGPEIEKLARKGDPKAIPFPRPMLHSKDYNFSFSGLKTAVLYYLRNQHYTPNLRTSQDLRFDVAASFQAAAIDVLIKKVERAAEEFSARAIMLGGGVAANSALRTALGQIAEKLNAQFIAAPKEYATDNAAMIAVAAYIRKIRRKKSFPLVADSTIDL